MTNIIQGDCREVLKTLPDGSVDCCVTSPPYFNLRDYGVDGQIGLEQTPDAYVARLVEVFREVRRVLRDDGTLWLNLGDSYAGSGKGPAGNLGKTNNERDMTHTRLSGYVPEGLKPKDLIGIPWRVAFALQADGWYLRQDIIWHKPNPMPESVTDRCTKAHEYVFLMSKSERYYFDQAAILEPVTADMQRRIDAGHTRGQGKLDHSRNDAETIRPKMLGRGRKNAFRGQGHTPDGRPSNRDGRDMREIGIGETRNKRSVWTVNTRPYKEAHFATFPPALISPMILAGCPLGGTVLDPFGGSGTTGEVAERCGRNSILIELNPEYIELQKKRTAQMGLGL